MKKMKCSKFLNMLESVAPKTFAQKCRKGSELLAKIMYASCLVYLQRQYLMYVYAQKISK